MSTTLLNVCYMYDCSGDPLLCDLRNYVIKTDPTTPANLLAKCTRCLQLCCYRHSVSEENSVICHICYDTYGDMRGDYISSYKIVIAAFNTKKELMKKALAELHDAK